MRRRTLWVSTAAVFATAATLGGLVLADPFDLRGPAAAGDELDVTVGGSYEWGGSRDVGEVFSSMTPIGITAAAEGPIRIVEVNPVNHQGDAVTYLGALVRVNIHPGDTDPEGLVTIPTGYPPEGHQLERFRTPSELEVRPPQPGQSVSLHVVLGYVAVREGTFSREGVEIIYEYRGRRHRVVEPNRIFICVPRVPRCDSPD